MRSADLTAVGEEAAHRRFNRRLQLHITIPAGVLATAAAEKKIKREEAGGINSCRIYHEGVPSTHHQWAGIARDNKQNSARTHMTSALLPPSSSIVCASRGAQEVMILEPVAELPVKETIETAGFDAKACPASRSPAMTLKTPAEAMSRSG